MRDDAAGAIGKGGSFVRPVTENDRKKLNKGIGIIKKIFKAAGAGEDSIHIMKEIGAHQSVTCRIGTVVDANLETLIGGLYCCDASVFPASPGTTVVWTLLSPGKKIVKTT
ncbi:MAG: GMC family oxidoreductase [Spirochaetes bacterium]|nr:GMC family oxidoreductase [Spirochaetota bacterium]